MAARRSITSNSEHGIVIKGLSEFTRALKVASAEAPAAMKEANYRVANRFVKAARVRATGVRGSARKASGSLRASRSATYSAVSGGGPRYPYFYGAEFGSKRYAQFQSWRGNRFGGWSGGPGYFLHPTIRKEAPAAMRDYWEELDALTSKAFPD